MIQQKDTLDFLVAVAKLEIRRRDHADLVNPLKSRDFVIAIRVRDRGRIVRPHDAVLVQVVEYGDADQCRLAGLLLAVEVQIIEQDA